MEDFFVGMFFLSFAIVIDFIAFLVFLYEHIEDKIELFKEVIYVDLIIFVIIAGLMVIAGNVSIGTSDFSPAIIIGLLVLFLIKYGLFKFKLDKLFEKGALSKPVKQGTIILAMVIANSLSNRLIAYLEKILEFMV